MNKKKAKLIFKHNSFDILEDGNYVLCAVSGKEILLKDAISINKKNENILLRMLNFKNYLKSFLLLFQQSYIQVH